MCRGLPLGPLGPLSQPKPQVEGLKSAGQRLQQFDDEFLQFTYKVVPCDKTWRHDYATCPLAHTGESSERRHPSAYLPFMCGSTQHSTDLKEKCPFGASCKYAHGHFELWLHPGRFRTKLCSLGGNCRRPVCFFAHSAEELRVTPYSQLDTSATVAAQQLGQVDSTCNSIATGSVAPSSRSSSDGSELKSGSFTLLRSSPCGSEAAHSLLDVKARGSPSDSVACDDSLAAFTAGMVLSNQTAMLELQVQQQNNALLAAADAGLTADAAAPTMWLTGSSNGMLAQQLPMAASLIYGNLLPQQQQQQQVMYLDANAASSQVMAYAPQVTAIPVSAGGADLMNGGWVLPANAAPAATRLADQWVANNMLVQQQQSAFCGMAAPVPACNTLQMQCLPVASMMNNASMMNTARLDQWLQPDSSPYGAPPGLSRSAMGCSISQQQPQQPATVANARMAQLLSTLPDQTVQQLLGMLTVEAQGA